MKVELNIKDEQIKNIQFPISRKCKFCHSVSSIESENDLIWQNIRPSELIAWRSYEGLQWDFECPVCSMPNGFTRNETNRFTKNYLVETDEDIMKYYETNEGIEETIKMQAERIEYHRQNPYPYKKESTEKVKECDPIHFICVLVFIIVIATFIIGLLC